MDTIITEFLRQFLDEFSLRFDFFFLFILFLCSQRAVEHFSFEDIFVFVFNGKQRLMMVKKRLMWWFALKMSLRLSNASIWECFILDILVYLPFFSFMFPRDDFERNGKKKNLYIQKLSKQTHSQRHIHHSHTHTCYNVRNTTVSVIKKVVQCKCQKYSIYEDTTLTEFTFKFVYHLFVIHLWLSMQPIS